MTNRAKKLLRDEDTCTSICLDAVDALLTDAWWAWEPESVWLELDYHKVDIPVSNREQIMAGRALLTTGSFWYDAVAFEKACIAFNNEETAHVGMEDAPVHYIAWALDEAEYILKQNGHASLVLDREPALYTAIQLAEEGFITTPDNLHEYQPLLDKQLRLDDKSKKLQKEITTAWGDAPKDLKDLLSVAYPETAAGVQLMRLAHCRVYVEKRRQARLRQRALLS